jgi:D-alanine transaminase
VNNLYLNGEYLSIDQGRVSVEDRGFQFGDGVYEVIRVYAGKAFRLKEHLKRLERSLSGVEIPLPEPLPKIEEVCRRVSSGFTDAQIYLQITRGAAPRVHAFPKGIRPTFVAYARALGRNSPAQTFSLKTVLDDRWGRCNLKVVCLLANILGRQKAVEAGCDEGLFVREDGTVTEGTSSNAFFVAKGTVVTHPATNRILAGITREAVLEVARSEKVPVDERPMMIDEARAADEAFVSGTGAEIMPVVTIDGKPIGNGKPGPMTFRLRAALQNLIGRETAGG